MKLILNENRYNKILLKDCFMKLMRCPTLARYIHEERKKLANGPNNVCMSKSMQLKTPR